MEKYRRIALTVEAIFRQDGSVIPRRIHCGGTVYDIDRVLRVGKYCPTTVAAIAPLEYTVTVDGAEKKLYYEADSNTWFSVKVCANG